MKIGIITFHWGINYGGVLQAYAMQKYLQDKGNNVEIIDYYPKYYKKSFIDCIHPRNISSTMTDLYLYLKEARIERFRRKFLTMTQYYSSNDELKSANFDYDMYISGSDQIWNMWFTEQGEMKKTFSYFLDFAPDKKILVSYAASFGTEKCKECLEEDIIYYLSRYDYISVREKTGHKLVKDLGFEDACVVPDPTLLLDKSTYINLCKKKNKGKNAFIYMLHNESVERKMIDYLSKKRCKIKESKSESVRKWLSNVRESEIVITNSFHAIVFSIIFNVPFVAITIDGSGMNDRIYTLLDELGLSDRIYAGDISIIDKDILWCDVEQKLKKYRNKGYEYISKILDEKEGCYEN